MGRSGSGINGSHWLLTTLLKEACYQVAQWEVLLARGSKVLKTQSVHSQDVSLNIKMTAAFVLRLLGAKIVKLVHSDEHTIACHLS